MSSWKPIQEYPLTVLEPGPIVLARTKDKMPLIVRLVDGHFIVCPGVPVFYGKDQLGMMTADNVVEFTEIPE